jgi:hypothetical protein
MNKKKKDERTVLLIITSRLAVNGKLDIQNVKDY